MQRSCHSEPAAGGKNLLFQPARPFVEPVRRGIRTSGSAEQFGPELTAEGLTVEARSEAGCVAIAAQRQFHFLVDML